MSVNVELDKERNRFIAKVEGQLGMLDFKKVSDDHYDYYRTFVPEDLRNQGIASKIVKHALDYAKDNNIKITPSCSFVKDFVSNHDEYKALIKP